MIARLDPASLRAAYWAWRALGTVGADLPATRVDEITVTPPPRLPARALAGVEAVLRRRQHTCLMRALILQSWFAAQGDPREVVIGVTPPSKGFKAHAWIAGEAPCHDENFTELTRWPQTSGGDA